MSGAATLTDRQFLRLEILKAVLKQVALGYHETRVQELEAFVLAATEEDGPTVESPFGELHEVTHMQTPEGERHFRGECGLVILRKGG